MSRRSGLRHALHLLHPRVYYALLNCRIETIDEELGELGAIALLELECLPKYLVTRLSQVNLHRSLTNIEVLSPTVACVLKALVAARAIGG